jgi:predicted TIM-barrel fold metal-dependent hydrolase
MTTRRNFFGGVAFCGCGLLADAHAQPRRQAVAVEGRPVRTIDVHAHCIFTETAARLGPEAATPASPVRGANEVAINVAQRFAAMDAQKVDMEVLSVNPYWYNKPRDLAAEIVRLNNEHMAALCAAHPDRFAGFCALTLQDPQLAVRELELAVRQQGLKGAAIGCDFNGVAFADPRFHPIWAKAEELGCALFLHPLGVPELAARTRGNGWLANTVAFPTETTLALSHLIFSGTLDRFPGLIVISAHGGGYLPSYADRMDHACMVNPSGCDASITLRKKPSEYLNQMYFDSLVFSPEALRHLAAQVGPGQLMLGSDYPFPWQLNPVDHVMATDTLSAQQKADILGNTAARVLKITG